MESFVRLTGIAAPLLQANIDTDQIIPTRFLSRLSEEGLGEGLFAEWRTRADGTPNQDFILNRAPWDRAEILVAGPNFGCGSSREAAPRALRQRGFRAVIAPSFGDIFHTNCLKNGLLPIALPEARTGALCRALLAGPGSTMTIDLAAQSVAGPDGQVDRFEIDAFAKAALLSGLDELAMTLTYLDKIEAYEAAFADAPGA
jgi:3-isopropylmalate/(R)-2-methylmalate dehydratase small subunit